MMNNLSVAALLAVTSLSLVACAAPDDQGSTTNDSDVTSKSDYAADAVREPAPFARTPRPSGDLKAGAIVDPNLGVEPISQTAKEGVAPTPPIAHDHVAHESFVEQCSGVWSCTNTGLFVLHREGTSCMLGDVVLQPDGSAENREDNGFAAAVAGARAQQWHLEAQTIYVPFRSDITTRCDRQD